MNCFNHPDIPAVGICKYCQRGLCKDCAIDSGCGIACKHHQENVRTLITIQADSKEILQNIEMLVREILWFFVGIFFILLGHSTDNSFVAIVGIVIFCFSTISALARMKKTQNK